MYSLIIDMINAVNIVLAIEFCIIAYGVIYTIRVIESAKYKSG